MLKDWMNGKLFYLSNLCWSNSNVVWSTFDGGVCFMYMKLYVCCGNGLEGIIYYVKWVFWYVYVLYVSEGWNEHVEGFMSK